MGSISGCRQRSAQNNFEFNVAIEEIIAPNKTDNYNRYNPIGFNPRIKIKNLGKENLRTLVALAFNFNKIEMQD